MPETPNNVEGGAYTGEVLTPHSFAVMRTSYMTTDGVGHITLLEMSGTYKDLPFTLAFEFTPKDATTIGWSLIDQSVGR